MADLIQGTDIQTVFLPDGSILITQEGIDDVGVSSSDYWQWDDEWLSSVVINSAIDAILKAVGQISTTALDAILSNLSTTYTEDINIDAILQQLVTLNISIDAVLEAAKTALSYGEENPTDGELIVGWNTWSDGAGGSVTVIGDAEWGKLQLLTGEIAHSPVYRMGAGTHTIKLTENKYGSADGNFKIYIRGQATSFGQDDGSPSWEEYTTQVVKTWVYIQVKLEGQ